MHVSACVCMRYFFYCCPYNYKPVRVDSSVLVRMVLSLTTMDHRGYEFHSKTNDTKQLYIVSVTHMLELNVELPPIHTDNAQSVFVHFYSVSWSKDTRL